MTPGKRRWSEAIDLLRRTIAVLEMGTDAQQFYDDVAAESARLRTALERIAAHSGARVDLTGEACSKCYDVISCRQEMLSLARAALTPTTGGAPALASCGHPLHSRGFGCTQDGCANDSRQFAGTPSRLGLKCIRPGCENSALAGKVLCSKHLRESEAAIASLRLDSALPIVPTCNNPNGHEDNGTGECTHCGLLRDAGRPLNPAPASPCPTCGGAKTLPLLTWDDDMRSPAPQPCPTCRPSPEAK